MRVFFLGRYILLQPTFSCHLQYCGNRVCIAPCREPRKYFYKINAAIRAYDTSLLNKSVNS